MSGENGRADRAGPFTHPALFYRGREEYLAGTVPFIRDGLAAGEPVAVAVPGPNLKELRAELGAEADRVHCVDMTRAGRNPGWIIPGVLRAFADAHPAEPVRIIGEPIWPGRTPSEYSACVQHEALINLAFAGRAVTIVCPYDADGLHPVVLEDARATHPVLVERGTWRNSGTYAPEDVVAACNRPLAHPRDATAFAFDAARLPQARCFAAEQARRLGMADRFDDLKLAVAELTTNSVVHGGGGGTLRIWDEAGRLVCQVEDGGRLTDPLAGRRPPGHAGPGGRGLLLVNHLSDLVLVHTGEGGTTIRLHMDR